MENSNPNGAGGGAGGQDKGGMPANAGNSSLSKETDIKVGSSRPVFPSTPVNKPDSIAINFVPKVADSAASVANVGKTPQLISMEIKREDLKNAASEKKGFLSGLFGQKPAVQSKPSSAWGNALDVPRDVVKKTSEAVPAVNSSLISSAPLNFSRPSSAAAAAPAAAVMNIAAPATIMSARRGEGDYNTRTSGISESPASKSPAPLTPTLAVPTLAGKEDFFASSSLQEKAGTSKLMENIVSQKAQLEQPKIEDLLGKKSTILEKSIEQESQLKLKKKKRLMQFMTFLMLVLAVGVNGFFYYQLSPGVDLLGYAKFNFDSNLRNDVFNLNKSLKSVQTELNKNRYLSGQLYLNQFGYESTRFIDGIANFEAPGLASDKNVIQSVIAEAKTNMPMMLAGAKDNLAQPITVYTYTTRGEDQVDATQSESEFERLLRQAIVDEKKSKMATNAQGNLDIPVSSLAFYDNAAKLVGNNKLMASLKASTVAALTQDADDYGNTNDPAQRTKFRAFIDNLLASTKVNLATITDLKNSRLQWKDVIDRIEEITNTVNTGHNNGISAANGSVISYSNFDLNSDTGKISISGTNTTKSGTNREVVTYLMEAFEASPEFKNVVNRSFPLSKSTDLSGQDIYTINFKLDMDLEKGAFSKLNEPVANLQGQKVAVVKVPVKQYK